MHTNVLFAMREVCGSHVWFLVNTQKVKGSFLLESIPMETNQQAQNQGATKQAMIYICGGEK